MQRRAEWSKVFVSILYLYLYFCISAFSICICSFLRILLLQLRLLAGGWQAASREGGKKQGKKEGSMHKTVQNCGNAEMLD
jgi:hypothetical protein